MSIQTKTTLKTYFNTGDIPTEAQYVNLIDSFHNAMSDGSINTTAYLYLAASETADTVNDWRMYGDSAGLYVQFCTVANAVKGSGTWVTKFTIEV
jgi:hypothetical protein